MQDKAKAPAKFAEKHFTSPVEREDFTKCFATPERFSGAVVWTKARPESLPFPITAPELWQPACADRVEASVRPGQHPLHDQGFYYCLDFSSVFEAAPLALISKAERVLDMCAAPGGKSILASQMLLPQHLISNEVIGKRSAQLISNLKRCAIQNAEVTRNDSAIFCQYLPGQFDLVLVDAPCSGQSLLLKGIRNPGCFHKVTVERNAKRQRRILANSAAAVAPGGYLLYTTCTYSTQENEDNVRWLCKTFDHLTTVEFPLLEQFRSRFSDDFCYRLWPQSKLGAGGFTALLRDSRFEQHDNLTNFESGLTNLRRVWQS